MEVEANWVGVFISCQSLADSRMLNAFAPATLEQALSSQACPVKVEADLGTPPSLLVPATDFGGTELASRLAAILTLHSCRFAANDLGLHESCLQVYTR